MKSRLVTAALLLALPVSGQSLEQPDPLLEKARKTEQWEPTPPRVVPGDTASAAPADAIVLFDGRSLEQWVNTRDKSPAGWTVGGGVMTVDKKVGNIETKLAFRNYQLHLEWRVPPDIAGQGQVRGNSGVFLAATGPGDTGYELQILDSWDNPTYVNGQAASIYKQSPPLVNATKPTGEWQTYDVIWTAPTFTREGALQSPAHVTVLHNGVLVQNHFALKGETVFVGEPRYLPYGEAPIKLQAHGDPSIPISFRNIWIRKLD
ncbi:MAG: hypothetical protein RLZZ200_1630 [Pseudomonadota bacterium]